MYDVEVYLWDKFNIIDRREITIDTEQERSMLMTLIDQAFNTFYELTGKESTQTKDRQPHS